MNNFKVFDKRYHAVAAARELPMDEHTYALVKINHGWILLRDVEVLREDGNFHLTTEENQNEN